MKYKITAVIPTVQYGNIQPCIEVEADTFEQANAEAMPHIEKLWAQYAEKPLQDHSKTQGKPKKVKCFVGGDILFDEVNHVYTNDKGDVYLSGSQYAKKFEKPFNAEMISGLIAKKFEVDAAEVRKMWELKGQISSGLGTAIHAALELYGRYKGLSEAIEKTTHLHDHPIVQKAVESFYEGREDEEAVCEAFVVDHENKRVGQIDRLLITGDKVCRVQDYKCNAVLTKEKLKIYWKQLEFYAGILQTAGWTVEGLDIHHWDGEWHTITKEEK